MNAFKRLRLLVLALTSVAAPLAAQDLALGPPLAADVEALPRLTGDTAIARQINATLQMLDERDFEMVTCEGEYPEDASRSVEILSEGPEFLSFLVSSGGACEGASYPFAVREVLNFDLQTGGQTDLAQFLPEGWAEKINADEPEDDLLLSLYLDVAGEGIDEDCRDILTSGTVGFEFGLDGQGDRLMILPDGLRHIEVGCETPVFVPVDRLRATGFHPRLIQTLSASP